MYTMKNNKLRTIAAISFATMLLISGCSVEKRHYLSGYSISWNGSKNKVSANPANENKQADKVQPASVSSLVNKKTDEIPQEIGLLASTKSMSFAKDKKTSNLPSKLFQSNPQASKHIRLNQKAKEEYIPFLEKEKIANQKSSGGDTYLIIEIILCFFPFINLIAMYLKDGKRITLNFWIDLLLDILFILPGIIFALLVVLDVVNLA